jgi:parvulin-like peptidyl-prolyl isomerase
MTKIRENLSKAFAVFAGVFVVYIVLDWGMDLGGRRNRGLGGSVQDVGSVDGDIITYKDFNDLVKQAVDGQKAQTGVDPDETQQKAIRDQVWSQLIDEHLYSKEMSRLGISVTDQEIVNWVKGDNPPDFLKQQFTDSTGVFHRQDYEGQLANPANKAKLVMLEDFLRKQRMREKLQSVITASVRVTDADVMQKYLDDNIKYTGDYILFDPTLIVKDTALTPTDDEIKQYYNDHSVEYKTDPTRKVKYVSFSEVASGADSDAVLSELQDVKKRADAGADFADMAKTYSEVPPAAVFHKHGEINGDEEIAVFDAVEGAVVGPFKENDGYHLAKVDSFKTGTDEFVHASHILFNVVNNDSNAALKRAKDVLAEIRGGGDFATLARQNSSDPTGRNGGDLGWFGKGRMVPAFDKAAFGAKVGQVVGPVRTQFGYHLIKVTGKDSREVRIIDIKMAVKASPTTKDALSQQAQDFDYLAKQGDFVKEAQGLKYNVAESQPFLKDAVITGVGTNNTLNKFAFANKVGKVSDAIPTANGFVVAMVSYVNDEGMKPLEDVRTIIANLVRRDKRMAKLKPMVDQARQGLSPSDSLNKLNGRYPGVAVQHIEGVAPSGFIPGVGRDPAFTGALESLPVATISQPISGNRGYFLIKVSNKTPFDSTLFNAQKEVIRSQIFNDRKSRFMSAWTESLKKSADIVDNRDQFFRE